MKIKSLLLIVFVVKTFIGFGQVVNIPDANFKTALLSHNPVINTNGDTEIQVSEAAAYTGEIDVSNKNISSLVGIESFILLDSLKCSSNNLNSLDITQNNALTFLDCYLNDLSMLDLTQNVQLKYLNCSSNDITSLDLTQITDLVTLSCFQNDLTGLDVTQNISLTEILCNGNGSIDTLNVSQNTLLETLWCDNTGLNSLDVTQCPALEVLYFGSNNVNSIDLSQNTNLVMLYCGYNNLDSLDVSQLSALNTLRIDGNNLKTIDISQNLLLEFLDCSDNILDSIDVSQNGLISIARCSRNNFTSLDFSQNPNLTTFECYDNNLVKVDIRNGNNTLIFDAQFRAHNNPNLLCVSADDPIWSTNNWVSSIDTQTSFSSDCDQCFLSIDSVQDVTCDSLGQIWSSFSGGLDANTSYLIPAPNFIITNNRDLRIDTEGFYNIVASDSFGCVASAGVLINGPTSPSGFDLNISGYNQRGFRPGSLRHFNIIASNTSCVPVSGQIQLIYEGPLNFDSAINIPPDLINGDTLIWNFSNWSYDSIQFMNVLSFLVDSSANIGDEVCFDLHITPLIGDADSTNNIRHYCYDIVNSLDPNDKQVYPQGRCNPKYILNDDKLTYTVRFQNTGNAEAIDVYILDSLDADLDVSTLDVISQSHEPMITEVLDSNVLKFRFDNILLPDSNSNEPESHGFVVYEINPLPGLANGTEITNSAAIYFDLNAPIITNTVLNTIIDVIPSFESTVFDTIIDTASYTLPNGSVVTDAGVYESVLRTTDNCDSIVVVNLAVKTTVGIRNGLNTDFDLSVYPNPASSSFTLKIEDASHLELVEVQNVLGQTVYATSIIESETIVQTNDWNDGIYHVLVKDSEGNLLASKKLVLLK